MHEINDDYFFLHDYFLHDHCFFFLQIRPTEESLHQKCSPRRGELDSSTLEVVGGLRMVVFEARRQTVESRCVNTPERL